MLQFTGNYEMRFFYYTDICLSLRLRNAYFPQNLSSIQVCEFTVP